MKTMRKTKTYRFLHATAASDLAEMVMPFTPDPKNAELADKLTCEFEKIELLILESIMRAIEKGEG